MILMESSLESNLNFCTKNKLIQRLFFLDKNCILPQCVSMLFRLLVTQSIFEATDIPPPTSAWFRDSAHCVGHETRALPCTLWQTPTFCSKNQFLNYFIFTVKIQIKIFEKIPWKLNFWIKIWILPQCVALRYASSHGSPKFITMVTFSKVQQVDWQHPWNGESRKCAT